MLRHQDAADVVRVDRLPVELPQAARAVEAEIHGAGDAGLPPASPADMRCRFVVELRMKSSIDMPSTSEAGTAFFKAGNCMTRILFAG